MLGWGGVGTRTPVPPSSVLLPFLSCSGLTCKLVSIPACRPTSVHMSCRQLHEATFLSQRSHTGSEVAPGRRVLGTGHTGPAGRIRESHLGRGFWSPNHLEQGLVGRWLWSRCGWPHVPGPADSSSSEVSCNWKKHGSQTLLCVRITWDLLQ